MTNDSTRLVWGYLTAFTLCVFSFGRYAARWHYGSGDQGGEVALLINGFASIVCCWALVRQIRRVVDR